METLGAMGWEGNEIQGGLVPLHLGFVVVLSSHAQSVCEWTQDDIRGMIYLQTCWLVPRFAADFSVRWTRGAGWEEHYPAESLCSLLPHCQPIVRGITPLWTTNKPGTRQNPPGCPPMHLLPKVWGEGSSLNVSSGGSVEGLSAV